MKAWGEAVDADRARNAGRIGPDFVSRHCNPVSPGGGYIPHGHHDVLAGIAQRLELAADLFRSKGISARAVDPQYHRRHLRPAGQIPQSTHRGLRCNITPLDIAVDDFTLRHDHRHLVSRRHRLFKAGGKKIVLYADLAKAAAVGVGRT